MGFFSTLGEERTVRMLLLPLTVVIATYLMDEFNDNDPMIQPLMHNISIQEDHDSFDPEKGGGRQNHAISLLLNYRDVEPWSVWIPRWVMWHMVFFSVTAFKLRVVPAGLHRRLAIIYGICMCMTQYTGFRNWPDRDTYLKYRELCEISHLCFAFLGCFSINIFETFFYWSKGARMKWISSAGVYFAVFSFIFAVSKSPLLKKILRMEHEMPANELVITGADLITQTVGLETFEFANFITHFVIVWHRAPAILEEQKNSEGKKKAGKQGSEGKKIK